MQWCYVTELRGPQCKPKIAKIVHEIWNLSKFRDSATKDSIECPMEFNINLNDSK